jgi:Ca2+-binding RTX toxin-like protein
VKDEATIDLTSIGSDLQGNVNANSMTGSDGKDTAYGKGGADTIRGLGGDDELFGGDGNDRLTGGSGDDQIYGDVGSAKDIVTVTTSNDTLIGGSGKDKLFGGDGNDILYGWGDAAYRTTNTNASEAGDGDDELNGGLGNNHFYGGAGADIFTAQPADVSAFYVSAYNSYDPVASIAATVTNLATFVGNFVRYEDQSGSGTVDFSATGKATGQAVGDVYDDSINGAIGFAGDTTFWGRSSGEIFIGNTGADTFMTSNGNDIYDGRTGTDTVNYFADTGADHTVNLQTNVNTGGFAQGDKLFAIENVIGSTGKDTFTGNLTVGTTLDGKGGDDTLTGGNLADTLLGDDGNDTLTGSDGNDTLSGGAGNDSLLGGKDNDTLTSGIGVDTLNGGDGNDTLDFRALNVDANLNGDSAIGGQGADIIRVNQSQLATSGNTFTADGGTESDTLEFYATGNGVITWNTYVSGDFAGDFTSINVLDLSKDAFNTNLVLSITDIQNMVDAGNSSALTVRLSTGDSITLPVGVTVQTGDNNYEYYDTPGGNKIASLVVDYV